MTYVKPEVLAQNQKQGSFAAGCPVNGWGRECRQCDKAS